MDSTQSREAARTVTDEIASYNNGVQDRRVSSKVKPGYLRHLLLNDPPTAGEKWEDIQKDVEEKIMPRMTHWQSPRFMGFFGATTTFPSVLGELYSAALATPAFNWECSPAITELEIIVLDWLAQLFKLPSCYLSSGNGGGVIQTSASDALLSVMVAARTQYLDEVTSHLQGTEKEIIMAHRKEKLVVLGSEMSHSSTERVAMVVGSAFRAVPVSATNNFSMTGEDLSSALQQCRKEGLEPFFLTATIGTTPTCAVDTLHKIREILKQNPNLWAHIDAAYAGAALILEEHQHLSEHIGKFDSFGVSLHKWLLVNLDASCLYVKSKKRFTEPLSMTPSYLRNRHSDSGQVTDHRDWQIPLTRRFRSIKVWFVLRTYGSEGLKAHIRYHIHLGELFHSLILTRKDLFKVVAEPAFALIVLTIVPHHDEPSATQNTLTQEIYEMINSRGEIYLTSTVVQGTFAIRVLCVIPKAEERWITEAFRVLVETTEEVLERHDAKAIDFPGERQKFIDKSIEHK